MTPAGSCSLCHPAITATFLLPTLCSEGSPAEVKLAGSYTVRPSHHTRPQSTCCREGEWQAVADFSLIWFYTRQYVWPYVPIWMPINVCFSSQNLVQDVKSPQYPLLNSLACLKAGEVSNGWYQGWIYRETNTLALVFQYNREVGDKDVR